MTTLYKWKYDNSEHDYLKFGNLIHVAVLEGVDLIAHNSPEELDQAIQAAGWSYSKTIHSPPRQLPPAAVMTGLDFLNPDRIRP